MRRVVRKGTTGLPITTLPPVPKSAAGIPTVQQTHTTVFLEEWAKVMDKDEANLARELAGRIRERGKRPNGKIAGDFAHELLDRGNVEGALVVSTILDRMKHGNYAKQHHIAPFVPRLNEAVQRQG